MPPQKYKSGMYLKCIISDNRAIIEGARLHTFMGETYWLYTIKEVDKQREAFHLTWTEYQIDGMYTIDTTAQVLYGRT